MKIIRPTLIAASVALTTVLLSFLLQQRATPAKNAGDARMAEFRLVHRTVRTRGFPAEISTNQTPSVRGTLPYVLAADGAVNKNLRQEVAASGVRVIGVPEKTKLLVEANPKSLAALAHHPRLIAAIEFLPSDKLDERLIARMRTGTDFIDVTVLSLSPADKETLIDMVECEGGKVLAGCLNSSDSFTAKVPTGLINTLAGRGDIRWLEAFSRPKLLNDMAVQAAGMNVREAWDAHGLSGSGQFISTSDSGIDTGSTNTMHRDLANKVCGIGIVNGCSDYDRIGHGTHTAGSIVGDGTMSGGEIRGTAYGAKLWAWFCLGSDGNLGLPDDTDQLFRPDQVHFPTFIHSASWGISSLINDYNSLCANFDDYVWRHPDFLPVVSAGNNGANGSGTINSPGSAKNVLTVGATQNVRSWEFDRFKSGKPELTETYSSRGPCTDGRIKPDVAAPGSGILSTRAYDVNYSCGIGNNTNYAYNCGTSMSTPLTAGSVALIREWLVTKGGYNVTPPSAALMKAIVMGGAKGAAIPNHEQGWGRVDVGEALFPSNRAVRLIDRIPFADGTNFIYVIETTNAAPLDVQLVWIDPPTTPGASKSVPKLVNNLNLTVATQTNDGITTWLGNGGTTYDDKNTAELVRIESAAAATYVITVNCDDIAFNHEEGGAAALYVRGAFDSTEEEKDEVTLTVGVEPESVLTGVSPAVGVYKVPRGAQVVFSSPVWAYEYTARQTPCARHAFQNFVGTGDVPSIGENQSFSAIISNDSSIVWRYTPNPTDYLLRKIAYINYFENDLYVSEEWIPKDAAFTLHFPKDAPLGDSYQLTGLYWRMGGWRFGTYDFMLASILYARTDDTVSYYLFEDNGSMITTTDVIMDESFDLYFDYYNAEERTSGNLPLWWKLRYLMDYNGESATATGDPDGDGFTNEAECADGTNPVDDESFRFKIDSFTLTNIVFTGSVKGSLIVEHGETLNGNWTPIHTTTEPRTSTTNSVDIPPHGKNSSGFYRVRHQKK